MAKFVVSFALIVIVATVFVSRTECSPVASELADHAIPADSNPISNEDMKAPLDQGKRQGRYYYGWPGGLYGGMGYGGLGGGSAASAAAAASASSTGGGYGYPYGR